MIVSVDDKDVVMVFITNNTEWSASRSLREFSIIASRVKSER